MTESFEEVIVLTQGRYLFYNRNKSKDRGWILHKNFKGGSYEEDAVAWSIAVQCITY
jgi:hypothetical protein